MNGAVVLPIQEFSLPYQKTAGCLLREARELKGLSQESVASTLNLMTSHIVAMESDAYNPHIEGKHFAAYLKSYARLVELNPQILLGLYQGQAVTQLQGYGKEPAAQQQAQAQNNGLSLRIVTVVALLGLALLFTRQGIDAQQLSEKGQQWATQLIQANIIGSPFFSGREPSAGKAFLAGREPSAGKAFSAGIEPLAGKEPSADQEPSAHKEPSAIKEPSAGAGIEQLMAENLNQEQSRNTGWRALEADFADEDQASTLSFANEEKNTLAAQASLHGMSGTQQAGNIIVTPSDATYQAYRLDVLEGAPTGTSAAGVAAAKDVLQFTFAGNCWVEVYDSNQNPIVMETKLEGELLNISGEAPFEVRVGNSRAVSLLLNGEPVHIEQHPTIDSTELIVGQR